MSPQEPTDARPGGEPPSGGPPSLPPPIPDGVTAGWGAPPTPAPINAPLLVAQAVGLAVLGAVAWALLRGFADLQLSLISVVTGSLVGNRLARALRVGVPAAVLAAVLTAVSSLSGEVVGVWLRLSRTLDLPFSLVRSQVSAQEILRHFGAIAWLFVLAGVVFAALAALGRYDRFGGGRRPRGFGGRL